VRSAARRGARPHQGKPCRPAEGIEARAADTIMRVAVGAELPTIVGPCARGINWNSRPPWRAGDPKAAGRGAPR